MPACPNSGKTPPPDSVHIRFSFLIYAQHQGIHPHQKGNAPELRSYLLARGSRLDQSKPGHSFGLSIALEIVKSYGGELSLGQDPDWGGLQVRVTLPAEAHQPAV